MYSDQSRGYLFIVFFARQTERKRRECNEEIKSHGAIVAAEAATAANGLSIDFEFPEQYDFIE